MSHRAARQLLDDVLLELGVDFVQVAEVLMATTADAMRERCAGSPTIRIDGRDVFPTDDAPALTCRVYRRADGRSSALPDRQRLMECLREAFSDRSS